MKVLTKDRGLHQLFEIGVVLKGVSGVVEFVVGVLLLFVNVRLLVFALTRNEIIEDPTSFVATHLRRYAGHITPGGEFYTAMYLIAQGVIKTLLVWALLRGKWWAYPAAFSLLSLIVAIEIITFARTHSIPLLILTIFDAAVVALIVYEYRHHVRGPVVQP